MVTDKIRRRTRAVAALGLADRADLDLVLCVPYVQQENIVHQHGVGRNHTTCQTEQRRLASTDHVGNNVLVHELVRTRSDASVGQVRGDCDPPAFVDTHAPKAAVHPCDESAQAHLADERFASVMTANRKEVVDERLKN